jgi:thiamine-monophosphate kinase
MVTMSELGEKAFLKALLPTLKVAPSFVNGFGHDASIVDVGLEQCLAVKIDRAPFPVALHYGVGDFSTWGRLAVVANVSDLLAVGANPHALTLSLVVPGGFDAADARAIVMGCEEACASHGIAFVGGDTKEGQTAQVIGAAWGTVAKGAEFGRATAMPGDYLFLAGQLGAFAGTLRLMDARPPADEIPREWIKTLIEPTARVHEGRYLRESRKVAAACDLSDGLADALNIFCAAGAGITLSESRLPMHQLAVQASAKCGVPLWRFAFGVGDWAIACVVRDKDAIAFRLAAESGFHLMEIGRFDDTGRKLISDGTGMKREIPSLINEQFRRRIEDNGTYLHELLHGP